MDKVEANVVFPEVAVAALVAQLAQKRDVPLADWAALAVGVVGFEVR